MNTLVLVQFVIEASTVYGYYRRLQVTLIDF